MEPGRLQNLATALELAGHKSLDSSAVRAPFAILRFPLGVRFTAWGDEFTIEQKVLKNSKIDSRYLMAITRSVVHALGFEIMDQISLKSHFLRKHPNPFEFMIKTLVKSDSSPRNRPYALKAARASFIYALEPQFTSISPQTSSRLTVSVSPYEGTSAMRVPHLSIRAEVTFIRLNSADFLKMEEGGEYYYNIVREIVNHLLSDGSADA